MKCSLVRRLTFRITFFRDNTKNYRCIYRPIMLKSTELVYLSCVVSVFRFLRSRRVNRPCRIKYWRNTRYLRVIWILKTLSMFFYFFQEVAAAYNKISGIFYSEHTQKCILFSVFFQTHVDVLFVVWFTCLKVTSKSGYWIRKFKSLRIVLHFLFFRTTWLKAEFFYTFF